MYAILKGQQLFLLREKNSFHYLFQISLFHQISQLEVQQMAFQPRKVMWPFENTALGPVS